ncbi:MAG: peptide-methionine (S)-S-oxide reductase [Betaproteobacteria bacterium]|nr:peptide-methionine (S)-S-oxide reductase [Betaproteobacteria bacterium]
MGDEPAGRDPPLGTAGLRRPAAREKIRATGPAGQCDVSLRPHDDEEQKRLAEASKAALLKNKPFKSEIVTEITRAAEFYAAEDYHQDYYQKNPVRYKFYKTGCGRAARLKQLWG